ANQRSKNPPRIIIHGNQTDSVPGSYKRYLENSFREHLKLVGTPIRIEFKGGSNPFADKKKVLSKGIAKDQKKLDRVAKKINKNKRRR
ncbi:MAG: ribosome biogenesis GTPase Der, partial [Chromatiales bacterium]|nr:ribosome biogenesis GTPase Der [Chromatiales bacterium]